MFRGWDTPAAQGMDSFSSKNVAGSRNPKMSNLITPRRPRFAGAKRIFAIVASQFNPHHVQGLVDHAMAELGKVAPGATTSIHRVPGAFEVPVVVRELALHHQADAIIACGVILRGDTNHADNLSGSVTDALQRIAVRHGVPVINVVLSFDSEDQARERCLGEEINRGTEAARAAVEIVQTLSDIRAKKGQN
jgi:6,7-dimethyl-8-ribityllumazine synthase